MNFIEIDPEDFKVKQATSDIYLIDVRESYEFEDTNIGGVNIPMGEILSRTDELENKTEICLCCASGKRSKTVAYHLALTLENTRIYSLNGGITNYSEKKL